MELIVICCAKCCCLLPRRPRKVYRKPWKKVDFFAPACCCCFDVTLLVVCSPGSPAVWSSPFPARIIIKLAPGEAAPTDDDENDVDGMGSLDRETPMGLWGTLSDVEVIVVVVVLLYWPVQLVAAIEEAADDTISCSRIISPLVLPIVCSASSQVVVVGLRWLSWPGLLGEVSFEEPARLSTEFSRLLDSLDLT